MRRRIHHTVIIAALLTAAPAVAHAQIGRLRKIGADVARDAAGVPKVEPVKTGNDITITPERLDAVVTFLGSRLERYRIEQEARVAAKEFETWQRTFVECIENAAKGVTIPSSEGMEAANQLTAKMAPLMERMSAHISANNKLALEYVQDTLRVLGSEQQQLMFGATRCGKARYTPKAIIESRVARASNPNVQVDESGSHLGIDVPANRRGGMSHYQFGMVRERMALWALMQDGVVQAEKAGKSGIFSDAERAALAARSSDIKALAPLFRDGTIRWTNWGDITSW